MTLEQIFLRLRGGHSEFLLVFENLAGARHRETLKFPTRNSIEATRRAAKHLAYRGDITLKKLRFRVETDKLKDDSSLKQLFINEFNLHSEENSS